MSFSESNSLPNSSTSLTYSQVVSEPAIFVEPSILRTGTGSIDVAAAVDVALTDPNNPDPLGTAVIYTAGKPVEGAPQGSPYTRVAASGILYAANYNDTGLSTLLTGVTNADGGGDITIVAGKDVIGTEAAYDTVATYQASLGNGDLGLSGNQGAYIGQFWVPWLLEQPDDPSQSWYVNFGSFQQGVMSLGGNVTVKAAHDIKDFSVSLPTSAYVTGSGNSKNLVRIGGGKLTVEAGNDIDSGSYYVGHGTGTITAGGKIASDFTYISVTDPNSAYAVATLLAVQDAQISVSARQSAEIGGIYDPTY